MSIKVKFEQNRYLLDDIKNRAMNAISRVMDDIHEESNLTTPLRDGNLRGQVTKVQMYLEGEMTWDVPYSSYQERGMRADGTHVIRNYTTPGTGPWFAKNAVEKINKQGNFIRHVQKKMF